MNKLVKNASFALLLTSSLQAECLVDYSVMYLIANQEMHIKKDIGYPYLISFNESKDSKLAKKKLKELDWLDARTLDCKNSNECVRTLVSINAIGVKNLDLGAYQINQKWYSYKNLSEYFNLKKSYHNACKIVYSHYKETGVWSWKTIARYHSKTPKHNARYAKGLETLYIKLKNKGEES